MRKRGVKDIQTDDSTETVGSSSAQCPTVGDCLLAVYTLLASVLEATFCRPSVLLGLKTALLLSSVHPTATDIGRVSPFVHVIIFLFSKTTLQSQPSMNDQLSLNQPSMNAFSLLFRAISLLFLNFFS